MRLERISGCLKRDFSLEFSSNCQVVQVLRAQVGKDSRGKGQGEGVACKEEDFMHFWSHVGKGGTVGRVGSGGGIGEKGKGWQVQNH